MWNRQVRTCGVAIKNWEGYLSCAGLPLGASGPSLTLDSVAQGISA